MNRLTPRLPSGASSSGSLPAGSCDTHVHVFDAAFPFAPDRTYTPATATVGDVRRHLDVLGLERVILMQPSIYGADNACLLSAIDSLGRSVARGVAVVRENASASEISDLAGAGVVGLRLNLPAQSAVTDEYSRDAFSRLSVQAANAGLIVSLHASPHTTAVLEQEIIASPAPVAIEHFGLVSAPYRRPSELATITRLLDSGNVWIKLSGVYKVSTLDQGYRDTEPFVRSVLNTAEDRVLWGSDWPHTSPGVDRRNRPVDQVEPFQVVDDAEILEDTLIAASSSDQRRRVLVENPASLFHF